jgi:hypothetical protein
MNRRRAGANLDLRARSALLLRSDSLYENCGPRLVPLGRMRVAQDADL